MLQILLGNNEEPSTNTEPTPTPTTAPSPTPSPTPTPTTGNSADTNSLPDTGVAENTVLFVFIAICIASSVYAFVKIKNYKNV